MVPCPHCGAENSAKKRVCHNCRKELAPSEAEKTSAPARPAKKPDIPKPKPDTRAPEERHAPFWHRPLFFLSATLAQRAQFYRQLEHLLKAGIPMVMALGHLEHQLPIHLRPLVRDLSARVQRGETLSSGMVSYPTIFIEWEVAIMRAAELSGDLHMAAGEVAGTLEMEEDLRRRINSSTIYLRAVVVVAIAVFLLLRNLQVMGGGLAGLVPALEATASQFLYVLAFIVLVWQGWRLWSRSRAGMTLNAALLARLPLIGPLTRNMMRARYALVLGALWNAGVPMMEAMTAAARASGNGHVLRVTEKNLKRITAGESVTTIIEETHFFPQQVLYMLRTGESSGSMPAALRKVAEYVQMEIESQAKALPTQIYLIVFFVVAGAVGWFVISFYLQQLGPVFELMGG
jgi:type IV pilus assembly protein PilC